MNASCGDCGKTLRDDTPEGSAHECLPAPDLQQPFKYHDVQAQRMTGVCCLCSEVKCDDDCRMGGARMPGDSIEFRSVVVNRTSGEVYMLDRKEHTPFPRSIATLSFEAVHRGE